jgi:tagatose 1,6-diphosphate aldolase
VKQRIISIGKRRGLISTSTKDSVFSVLAFDHRQSFVKMLKPGSGVEPGYQQVVEAKLEVIRSLSPHASAVLLDPLYGASQSIASNALPAGTGLIVAVEKTGYEGRSTSRESSILPGWGVSQIKKMGADAVKLLIYYHPDGGKITEKQELLTADIIQQCEREDIALFLEAVSYSIDPDHDKNSPEFAASRPSLIRRLAERLSRLDPDVLKIEFPVDATHSQDPGLWEESCQAVTESAACPWTVLSAGVDFPVFETQVEVACQAGASGFIGGRAVWKEGISQGSSARGNWLREVACDRMEKLNAIAVALARPWTAYYPLQDYTHYQDWYASYK